MILFIVIINKRILRRSMSNLFLRRFNMIWFTFIFLIDFAQLDCRLYYFGLVRNFVIFHNTYLSC